MLRITQTSYKYLTKLTWKDLVALGSAFVKIIIIIIIIIKSNDY
jgi:hypothetical protein